MGRCNSCTDHIERLILKCGLVTRFTYEKSDLKFDDLK